MLHPQRQRPHLQRVLAGLHIEAARLAGAVALQVEPLLAVHAPTQVLEVTLVAVRSHTRQAPPVAAVHVGRRTRRTAPVGLSRKALETVAAQ